MLLALVLVACTYGCTPPPATQENCQRLERRFHLLPWQSAGCFEEQQQQRQHRRTSSELRSHLIRHISPTPPPPPTAPCRLLGTAQYLTYAPLPTPYLPTVPYRNPIPSPIRPALLKLTERISHTNTFGAFTGCRFELRLPTNQTTRSDFNPPRLLAAPRSRGRSLLDFGLSLRSRRTPRPSCPSPIAIALYDPRSIPPLRPSVQPPGPRQPRPHIRSPLRDPHPARPVLSTRRGLLWVPSLGDPFDALQTRPRRLPSFPSDIPQPIRKPRD